MNSIIWDWNGTLLNDLDICISSINVLLEKRNLPLINRAVYKEVFSFPVKDYYQAIGFDFNKEDFSIPAREFIDLYEKNVKNCSLHPFALNVLQFFHENGIRQFILSAMQQEMLEQTLEQNGILDFFEGIAGLSDHYAVSKIERGKQLINEFRIEKQNSCIVGDTIHDYEVANELGIKCILVANGHQSFERLEKTGTTVLHEIGELISENIFSFSY